FHQHAFQVRQLNDFTGIVAHGSHVAYFGRRKQTFIFRIIPGNSMEKVDVFHGWQSVNFEIAEPPEMQTLPHHRMEATVKRVFFVSIAIGLESKVLQDTAARSLAWARY